MLAKTPLHKLIDRTTIDQWRRILLDGADFMERKGLGKGQLVADDGSVCARGAMLQMHPSMNSFEVSNKTPWYKADEQLEAFLHLPINGVPKWNNDPARTAQDVICAMRACALQGLDDV
jgi:hypothetical protein